MKKPVQILLFIILGIPGALVFVFSSILLIGKALDPKTDLPNRSGLLIACVFGIAAALIGIGKIKEWMYSLVFIAFPLSFWIWVLINPDVFGGTVFMLVFVGFAVLGSLKAVRYYYGRQENEV